MKKLCIIPARGGSKRIPKKNIKDFLGKPLIAYSIEAAKNSKYIEYLGFITNRDLAKVYNLATCFIYPSFYEGFGIPSLEAQACGTPVIVSNIASLPEVCGDSALYCNPYDINDIKEKIELLIENENLRQELIQKGFENIKRFSWEKSAKK